MLAIINTMIDAVEQPPGEGEPLGSESEVGSCRIEQTCLNQSSDVVVLSFKHTYDDITLALQPSVVFPDDSSLQNRNMPHLIRDFNYPYKSVGYLAQESTDLEFIGPDRQPVAITTLRQLLEIADIIRNTGFPNYKVDKSKFDESAFVLKFPNIDHITENIVNCTEECAPFKIDVTGAFRNLRVDPSDSLKLGICWKGQFYADQAVAFGWMH